MIVIALTAFIGLGLVILFVAMFIVHAGSGNGCEALLPLVEESPRPTCSKNCGACSGPKTPGAEICHEPELSPNSEKKQS